MVEEFGLEVEDVAVEEVLEVVPLEAGLALLGGTEVLIDDDDGGGGGGDVVIT